MDREETPPQMNAIKKSSPLERKDPHTKKIYLVSWQLLRTRETCFMMKKEKHKADY